MDGVLSWGLRIFFYCLVSLIKKECTRSNVRYGTHQFQLIAWSRHELISRLHKLLRVEIDKIIGKAQSLHRPVLRALFTEISSGVVWISAVDWSRSLYCSAEERSVNIRSFRAVCGIRHVAVVQRKASGLSAVWF